MTQNKYKYHDWDEYFRGHNVLNCNAVHQQSGPCRRADNKRECTNECEGVLKRLSVREAMKERGLKSILKHYDDNARHERWEPKKRKHLKAFICRDQSECMNPNSQDCRMCEQVIRDTQKEYNKRVRTTNKLGLRFEETNRFGEPRTFGKQTRKEDLRRTPNNMQQNFPN